jgi:hypothetical protein
LLNNEQIRDYNKQIRKSLYKLAKESFRNIDYYLVNSYELYNEQQPFIKIHSKNNDIVDILVYIDEVEINVCIGSCFHTHYGTYSYIDNRIYIGFYKRGLYT